MCIKEVHNFVELFATKYSTNEHNEDGLENVYLLEPLQALLTGNRLCYQIAVHHSSWSQIVPDFMDVTTDRLLREAIIYTEKVTLGCARSRAFYYKSAATFRKQSLICNLRLTLLGDTSGMI
jgi:hypothetical protein